VERYAAGEAFRRNRVHGSVSIHVYSITRFGTISTRKPGSGQNFRYSAGELGGTVWLVQQCLGRRDSRRGAEAAELEPRPVFGPEDRRDESHESGRLKRGVRRGRGESGVGWG
jgi:hypothetical protein